MAALRPDEEEATFALRITPVKMQKQNLQL